MQINTVPNIGGDYSFVSQNMRLHVREDVLGRLRGGADYDDIEDAILYSRFAHEYTHFFQNITTTYGLLKTLISRISGLGVLAALGDLPARLVAEYRPIKERIPKKSSPQNENWQIMLQQAWSMIQTLDFFENNHLVEEHHIFAAVNKPIGMTTPAISGRRGTQKITATMLMEYQALTQQVDAADRFVDVSRNQADAIAKSAFWRPAVINIHSLMGYALGIEKISRPVHRLAYELITLALNPLLPESPAEGLRWLENANGAEFVRDKKVAWEDIHPGWRFFSLIEHLRSTGTSPPADDRSVYEIISNAIENLGWRAPFDCLCAALSDFERSTIIFPELTANRQFRKHLIENVWSASRNSLDACIVAVSDPLLRRCCRGPFPSNTLLQPEACLLDEALSMLYSTSHQCCVCYREVTDFAGHREGCPIPELFAEMRRHGHIQYHT